MLASGEWVAKKEKQVACFKDKLSGGEDAERKEQSGAGVNYRTPTPQGCRRTFAYVFPGSK